MSRSLNALAAAALGLLLGLGACGKSGSPIPPKGTTFPRQFPAPRYVLPEAAEAEAGVEPEPTAEPARPERNLQFLPTEDTRIETRTFGPPTPVTPATPEPPATPETSE